MQFTSGFLDLVQRKGDLLRVKIMARDGLNLRPPVVTQTAARRLRAGLRALEAYVRRVILLLALLLERDLRPNQTPYIKTHAIASHKPNTASFAILHNGRAMPFVEAAELQTLSNLRASAEPVLTQAMFARLRVLKDMLCEPMGRARRLALYLARRHLGPVWPPGLKERAFPARFGCETSTLYKGLASAIFSAGRARPPPIGPRPQAGPRIRQL